MFFCKIVKNVSQNFYKHNTTNDGFNNKCSDCINQISAELRNSKIF